MIGRNAARDGETAKPIRSGGGNGVIRQIIDDSLLVAGGKVRQADRPSPDRGRRILSGWRLLAQLIQLIQRRRFQAAERKIQTVRKPCPRKMQSVGIPASCRPFQQRAAG